MTLNDELEVIDQTIHELERRRVDLINHMVNLKSSAGLKVIQFPSSRVTVMNSAKDSHVW